MILMAIFLYLLLPPSSAAPSAILRRCGATSFQKEAMGGFPKGSLLEGAADEEGWGKS
jgi:hypothetical protein